jgi:NAD(P)-dependent dehydrogenase (short-subunit alcohol dehydrogenase family)
MANTLRKRVPLVTGSTDGIGLAGARALPAEGCSVMLNGFGEAEAIAALCREFSGTYGVELAYSPTDLRDETAASSLMGEPVARFGRVGNAKLLAEGEQITRAEAHQRIAATNMRSGRIVASEQVDAFVASCAARPRARPWRRAAGGRRVALAMKSE